MKDEHDLMLRVWREACRHIRIDESTGVISRMISGRIPLRRLTVRRVDSARRRIISVSSSETGSDGAACEPDQRDFPESLLRRLAAWCRAGEVAAWHPGSRLAKEVALLLPSDPQGEALVGALHSEHGTIGALVAEFRTGHPPRPDHRRLFKRLMEPFSAAIENDARLYELAALREAAEADNRSLLARLGRASMEEAIIGSDGGLRPVLERVRLVAPSDVPVLIFGETGSGKEVIARAIHARSSRASKPFIRVNCGAMPPELIDSELFGHEKGSFTGANAARRGWFERADGGTLLLDEIGELPLAAQVRLLRVLQEKSFERVGGETPLSADVRVVAATHRDLAMMVRQGTFREDLWYRIAVFPILLPALRDHPGDLPELARHFIRRAAGRFGLAPMEPTPADLQLMASYPWPGNVRELGAVIDRAVILGGGMSLEIATALGVPSAPASRAADDSMLRQESKAETRPLDDAIRDSIRAALVSCDGRIEGPRGAAALLRINPHTLRSKMRRLGIAWSTFRNPPAP